MSQIQLIYRYLCSRMGIDPGNEDGMATTEVAILVFLLAGMAIAVGAIIYSAAKGNAENIPNPQQPG